MGLKLNTASSGSVTLEPANTASNYTLTVPAQTGTVVATNSSGNVGIGTSSPTFTGGSGIQIERSGTTATLELTRSDASVAGSLSLQGGSIQNNIYSVGAKPLVIYTNSSERMRIDSSGNLLLGTTSLFSGAGSKQSILWNPSGEQGIVLKASGTTFNGNPILFRNNTDGTSGVISQSQTTVTYGTSSDYRLKENIAPMTGALDKVTQLKPVTYTWKETGSDGQGFIAHELQAIVPDCVVGEKDAVNEDGSIKAQSIDTSFLVATLTAAIQELNAKVDAQATEIALLKGQA